MILPSHSSCKTVAAGLALLVLLTACGGGDNDAAPAIVQPVTLTTTPVNAVSTWHDIGVATVNTPGATATTQEELRTSYNVDMATMHIAIYDATAAIDKRYKSYGPTPVAAAAGASMEAAVAAAACGVLRALFPNRGAQYEDAYKTYVAAIAAGEAKDKGLVLGAEVAQAIVAMRRDDGRAIVLAPYVASTAAGRFRGVNPVSRFQPAIKPFVLSSVDQFRPAAPPALDSATYATDLKEVKALGGTVSTSRTADQLEMARFHTEAPPIFLTRNFGQFARTTTNVPDAARLMALIYVVNADALGACFEAKYFYDSWRPQSAIVLGTVDPDASWTPVLTTPNHPEYPAAHGCTVGGLSELMRQYYGTKSVTFSLDSKVTNTTRTYTSTDALIDEVKVARIYGGMHFRFATVAGTELGTKVANAVIQGKFGLR
jgi:hypothetical protein